MVGSNNGKIFNSPIEECIKRVTSSLTSSIKPFKQLPLDYILIAFHTSCIISYPIKLIVSPNFLINLLNQFTYRHYSIVPNPFFHCLTLLRNFFLLVLTLQRKNSFLPSSLQ